MTARKSKQAAPPAGSTARPISGGFYLITPGGPDGPEYFPLGLTELNAALNRAAFLSWGTPAQKVTVTRTGHPAKILFEYTSGRQTARPACVIPAAGPQAAQEAAEVPA
jgi:hypothetical protein